MDIYLFTFSKRKNSTKQPQLNTGTKYENVILKAGSSIIRPLFSMDFGLTVDPSDKNYLYVPLYDRYYFLQDWTFDGALWHGDFIVDVLASWKSVIGSSTEYILRSSYAKNEYLRDTMVPVTHLTVTDVEAVSTGLTNALYIGQGSGNYGKEGAYVVGIQSLSSVVASSGSVGDETHRGATTYYVFNVHSFTLFMQVMLGSPEFQVTDISAELFKSIVNPLQYITSCIWIPVPYNEVISAGTGICTYVTDISLGWWTFPIGSGAYIINTESRIFKSYTLTIPKHPQAGARGTYMNAAPFTENRFEQLPFGSFVINEDISCFSTLGCSLEIDACTGYAELTLTATGTINNVSISRNLGVIKSMIGFAMSLSQSSNNVVAAAGGVVTGVGMSVAGFLAG